MKALNEIMQSKQVSGMRAHFKEEAKTDPALGKLTDAEINKLFTKIVENTTVKMEAYVINVWECPLLKNEKWDCSKSDCKKGGEPFCTNAGHFRCPAFNKHFMYLLQKKIVKLMRPMEQKNSSAK